MSNFPGSTEPGAGTALNGAGSTRKQKEKSEMRPSFCSTSDILTVSESVIIN